MRKGSPAKAEEAKLITVKLDKIPEETKDHKKMLFVPQPIEKSVNITKTINKNKAHNSYHDKALE